MKRTHLVQQNEKKEKTGDQTKVKNQYLFCSLAEDKQHRVNYVALPAAIRSNDR